MCPREYRQAIVITKPGYLLVQNEVVCLFNTTSHYQPYTFIHPLIQGPFQNLSPAINTLLKAYALIHQAIIFPSTAMTCHLFTRPNC